MRNRYFAAPLGVLALTTLISVAQAVPITYSLSFDDGSNTLTGSITTDGTIGAINSANITGVSFTASGILSFSFDQNSSPFTFQCLGTAGCFEATASGLYFDFGSTVANDPFFNANSGFDGVAMLPSIQNPNSLSWTGDNPSAPGFPYTIGLPLTGRQLIGSVVAQVAVPEPGALVLLAVAVAAFAVTHVRHPRRANSYMTASA